MEDSGIEDTLDEAIEAFRRSPTVPEDGLSVDDPALLQLRKACRLLDAAEFLEGEDGYFTIVIEASFSVIERTLQFYLLDQEVLDAADFVSHEHVYELGEQAGLYDADFRDKLLDLWSNNRSRTYYREGVSSAASAAHMVALARHVHDHVLQLAGLSHECICRD